MCRLHENKQCPLCTRLGREPLPVGYNERCDKMGCATGKMHFWCAPGAGSVNDRHTNVIVHSITETSML